VGVAASAGQAGKGDQHGAGAAAPGMMEWKFHEYPLESLR
jgi:hypothetical protein